MEAIHCSSSSLPSSLSSIINQQTLTRRAQQLSFTKQKCHLPPRPLLRTRALDNAFSTLASSSTVRPGDISVLIPISALLFFVYWIANFVVPSMITKDLQAKASEGEEVSEPQENNFDTSEISMPVEQPQKIKKSSIKKIITRQ